jgi:hypothetical protein
VTSFLSAALFDRDGSTLLSRLDTSFGRQWLDERDSDGSFGFSIPAEDAAQVVTGRIVKFSWGTTSTSWVFAGVIEAVTINKTGGGTQGEDRVAEVSGRGVRCLLENALVYPVGTSTTRAFEGKKAGDIMRTLFDEAQARGVLLELSTDFTATTDSAGQAFNRTLTLSEGAGTTLAEVAARHQELAVDINVTADLVLQYFNTRGEDLTLTAPPVSLRVGESIGELTTEKAGPVRNTVLVGYDSNKYATRTDNTSVSTYGRRETFLNVSGTTNLTHAQLAGDQVLSVSAVPSDGITVQLDTSGPQPYINFNVCDFLWVIDHTGVRTKYRVSSISASESENGAVSFVPELGTLRADLTKRLNRALSSLESKNANGSSSSGTATAPIGTGGGEIVLLPGGVIQPAVVNIPGGYPLNLNELYGEVVFSRSLDPRSVRWDVRDLTSQGYFTRTLAIQDQIEPTSISRFYNLDNMTQGFLVPTSFNNNSGAFKVINGTYYSFYVGISRWTGSNWVTVVTANSSWQVGSVWYAVGRRPGDAQDSLWAFDETTEILSQVIGSGWLTSNAGKSIVGNGYAWVVVGSSTYWLNLSAPASWTRLQSTGFSANKAVVGMDVDGNLIGFNFLGGAGYNTSIHVLDRTGVVSVTTNPLGFIQDIIAAGGTVHAIAQDGSDSVYAEPGTSLGTTSGWILIAVIYSTAANPTVKLGAIFAVGPYGYTPVVYSEDPVYMVGARPNPHGYAGFEQLGWVPDSDEGAMRGALYTLNEAGLPDPTYTQGYQAFEWSVPVITP